jgi:hypothetical protein
MTEATRTMHFRARHEKRTIRFCLNRICQWLIETGPASATLEFCIGRKQRQIAPGASEDSLTLFVVKRASSGAFGTVLAQYRVLVRREALAPVGIRQIAIVNRTACGHRFSLAKFGNESERRKPNARSQQSASARHLTISNSRIL